MLDKVEGKDIVAMRNMIILISRNTLKMEKFYGRLQRFFNCKPNMNLNLTPFQPPLETLVVIEDNMKF